MGIFMLIVNVASLLIKLPDIWKQIMLIWEIIQFLREVGKDTDEVEKEFGGILVRYVGKRKNKDKKAVQGANDAIRWELAQLKAKVAQMKTAHFTAV